jgi:hypothetical protein
MQETGSDIDPDFELCSSSDPHLMTLSELNNLVTDLGLSEAKAELLASRLQELLLAVIRYEHFSVL